MAQASPDEDPDTGPFLSKIGIIALVVLVISTVGILVGLTQPWVTWTPETGDQAGQEQSAGFYELDSPAFLEAIGDNDFYLQEGAFSAMLALTIVAVFAFGLLSYELYGGSAGPASLRNGIASTVFVIFGTGTMAASNRFLAETSALSHNFQVQASTLSGMVVSLVAVVAVGAGLIALYLAASHRIAERARYDKDTQRFLTVALVALLGFSAAGYAAVSVAPWTELRGDFSFSATFPNAPGQSAFEVRNTDTFQITEHTLADAQQPKPLFEMKKDVQLVSAAAFSGMIAALGGLYGVTHLRNRGDNEGAQVLILAGAATVVAGLGILLATWNFIGHADELSVFIQQASQNAEVTADIAVAGLTNYVPLISGIVGLVVGGAYAMRVLPVSGQVVQRPSPATGPAAPGTGPEGGRVLETTRVETGDGEEVVVESSGEAPSGAAAQGDVAQAATGNAARTPAETLAELDQRLIEGDISEETYWDLRNRL